MAGLWVNECGNALDVELSAGVGEVEARGGGGVTMICDWWAQLAKVKRYVTDGERIQLGNVLGHQERCEADENSFHGHLLSVHE